MYFRFLPMWSCCPGYLRPMSSVGNSYSTYIRFAINDALVHTPFFMVVSVYYNLTNVPCCFVSLLFLYPELTCLVFSVSWADLSCCFCILSLPVLLFLYPELTCIVVSVSCPDLPHCFCVLPWPALLFLCPVLTCLIVSVSWADLSCSVCLTCLIVSVSWADLSCSVCLTCLIVSVSWADLSCSVCLTCLIVSAHAKLILFLTHCGMHGVLEAIHYGVPMVGIPVFIDQVSTGTIAHHGTGQWPLGWSDFSERKNWALGKLCQIVIETQIQKNLWKVAFKFGAGP